MATMYCELCGRSVEAKRRIGAGTVLLGVITAGLSLLAVPFYRPRCPICGSPEVAPTGPDGRLARAGASAELERRLEQRESQLEAASAELERVRTERDFYRKLLDAPDRDRGTPRQP